MFYKVTDDKEEVEAIKDLHQAKLSHGTKDGKENVQLETDIIAYNLITTSDKEINSREYPDANVKLTVHEDRWVQTFPKPFLINHDLYEQAIGRVCDAVYIQHSDFSQTGGKEKIPDVVIDFFKSKKCFDGGTGSVIGKIMCTKDTIEKIKSSVIYTTSQSSSTDAYTCNICGSDYWDCNHRTGEQYEIDGKQKKCVPRTGNLFPIENSSVNSPANDSSIIILYNTKDNSIILNSVDLQISKAGSSDDENEDEVEDKTKFDKTLKTQDNVNNEKTNKKEGKEMTEQEVKDGLKRIKDHNSKEFKKLVSTLSEDAQKEVSEMFSSIEDKSLQTVNEILEKVIATHDSKIKETEEKLKATEDKLAEAEEKIKKLEEQDTGDSQENEGDVEDKANGKTTIVPKEKGVEDEEESHAEPEIKNVYDSFTIKSKKNGGKK